MTKNRVIETVVFLTSVTIICFEVVLTRIFSLLQWHNFSTLIISTALLGFGISGTIIFIKRNVIEKNYKVYLLVSLFLYPLALSINLIVYCKIPFNPYQVGTDSTQIIYFLGYIVLIAIPFCAGANVIGISFLKRKAGFIYFYNMVGSGAGALAVIALSYLLHPFDSILIVIAVSYLALVFFSFEFSPQIRLASLICSCILLTATYASFDLFDLKQPSEYKSISSALNLPHSRIEHERFSPHGVVQVVSARSMRSTSGISLIARSQVPEQKGIFINGEGMSPLTPFGGQKKDIAYLHYVPVIIPYHIMDNENRNDVVIVGSGGGEGVLRALLFDTKRITALEVNPDIIDLMKHEFASFSGNIYNDKRVTVVNQEARSFFRSESNTFDLIDFTMVDSFNTAASGVSSLNETYLYTVEAIKDYYNSLNPGGILAITRWVMSPPRDSLKLFNICVSALHEMDVKKIRQHFICIRSIQSVTLLIKKGPFSRKQVEKTREFCRTRLFDTVYYPGIIPANTRTHINIPEPVFYNALNAFLNNNYTEFIDSYEYNLSAATDNQPYYYNFFKLSLLDDILKHGTKKIPFTEWGYLTLVIVLVLIILVSGAGTLVPLFLTRRALSLKKTIPVFLYFAAIGTAYFFIEISIIQKMILYLGNPVYSISLVIASLLIFSGIGSYYTGKYQYQKHTVTIINCIIGLIVIFYSIVLDTLLVSTIEFHESVKGIITVCLLLLPGILMGVPFPAALELVRTSSDKLVPWAWAVNSFFSVISIILAALFGVWFGFMFVLICASLLYICAGITIQWLND